MADDKRLAVITSYFNPAKYKTRRKLHAEVKLRIPELFTIELVNEGEVSEVNGDIQLPGSILWQKEALLSVGIKNRIDAGYESVCWVDADIEFLSPDWRERIIESLEQYRLVQCFSKCTSVYSDTTIIGQSIVAGLLGRRRGPAFQGVAWAARSELFLSGFDLYKYWIAPRS